MSGQSLKDSNNDYKVCAKCLISQRDAGRSFQTCARCKGARYCGKECQTADWKSHKIQCNNNSKNIAQLAAENTPFARRRLTLDGLLHKFCSRYRSIIQHMAEEESKHFYEDGPEFRLPIRWIHIELAVRQGVVPHEKMQPEDVFDLVDIKPVMVTSVRYRSVLGLYKMIEQSARNTPGVVSFVMFGVECEGSFRAPNIMIGEGAGDEPPTYRDWRPLIRELLLRGPDAVEAVDVEEAERRGGYAKLPEKERYRKYSEDSEWEDCSDEECELPSM